MALSPTAKPPPFDREAEQSVLGAVLLSEDGAAWDDVSPILSGGEFFDKKHQRIWRAIEQAVEKRGVADATTVAPYLNGDVPKGYLFDLIRQTPSVSAARAYALTVRDCAYRRHILRRSQELGAMALEGATPRPMVERLVEEVRTYEAGDGAPDGLVDAFEFADSQPPRPDWLVEPLLARQGRVILYAPEGEGKSLMSLQIAAQAACGFAPLGRFETGGPKKCLYVDLEQADYDIASRMRQLKLTIKQAGGEPGNLHILRRPDGIDAETTTGQGELERAVSRVRPDILFVDPLYKLVFDDMNKEPVVKAALLFLDRIRRYYGCGIWLVHHPRKSPDPSIKRGSMSSDLFGAGVLLRWTETLLVMPESDDRLVVQKLRHYHPKLAKGDDINFRRGGKWFFECTDGPAMTAFHREILKSLRRGPAKTAQIQEAVRKRRETTLAALRELDEDFGMIESYNDSLHGQHWRLIGESRKAGSQTVPDQFPPGTEHQLVAGPVPEGGNSGNSGGS